MSVTRIALLRGINVGRAKRIAMADLRRLFEELGYGDVRTLLNSGNVIFTANAAGRADVAARLENAIADRLGVTTSVVVLSPRELSDAIRGDPFAGTADDPARLLLMVCRDTSAVSRMKPIAAETWAPEAVAIRGRVAFLWCPGGIATSPLWAAANRALAGSATARNLTTMTKILAVAGEG